MQITRTRTRYFLLSAFGALVVVLGVLVLSSPAQAQSIAIDKAVDPNPVGVGESLTFTITLTTSDVFPNIVDVTDVLPPGVEFQSATVAPSGTGDCDYEPANNTVSCVLAVLGTPPFEPTTVTIEAIPTQCGTFTNTATGMPATGGEIADSAEFAVEGCPTPPPPPPPGPGPGQQPGQQPGAAGAGSGGPITQDSEQESEAGEIDQSFDVS